MTNTDEIISAALDGERVDVASLRAALATAEGRETLAAFVLLRAAAADDDLLPVPLPVQSVARARAATARTWSLAGYRVPATVAASIAVVAVALSFWMGAHWQPNNASAGSGTSQTVASRPAQVSRQGESSAAPAMVSNPMPAAPAETQAHQAAMTPCAPGTAAVDGRNVRRARLAAGNEPPKPTRFLRFVPGVDWVAAAGPL